MNRLAPSLALAVALHGAGLAVLATTAVGRGEAAAPTVEAAPLEVEILAVEPRTAAAADPGLPVEAREGAAPVERGRARSFLPEAPKAATSEGAAAPAAPAATSLSPFAEPGADDASKRARDALSGLARGGPGAVALGDGAPPPRDDAPRPAASIDLGARAKRAITDGLDARDRSLGLGAGSAVANAFHAAAMGNTAPREGAATFEIRLDANGNLVSARLASSRGGAWDPLLAVVRAQLAARKLTVPPGSNGVLLAVRVEARLQMPSAADHGPKGGGQFDLADLGARPSRVVSARVVSETRL